MDISRLRNTLKKLRSISFDREVRAHEAMAAQEMLDFLAMLDGIKPIYLLGRGFDDPDWIAGVKEIATSMSLKVVKARGWITAEGVSARPAWYSDMHVARDEDETEYFYICKAPAVAAKVAEVSNRKFVTAREEATLLGYPDCCVADYHEAQRAFDEMFFGLIERAANGDVEEMKRIVRDDDQLSPETPEEEALFRSKFEMHPAPFTSFNMCLSCSNAPASPAKALSIIYGALANKVDPELADEIAFYQAQMTANP